jgi:hypothetical protein
VAAVHYVACPSCQEEYYLDRNLSEAIAANPMQKLKCPFCKLEFHLERRTEVKESRDS